MRLDMHRSMILTSDSCHASLLPVIELDMPLIPRWRYMTPQAKAITRRMAISAAVLVLGFVLIRSLLPVLVLGLVIWWIWRASQTT